MAIINTINPASISPPVQPVDPTPPQNPFEGTVNAINQGIGLLQDKQKKDNRASFLEASSALSLESQQLISDFNTLTPDQKTSEAGTKLQADISKLYDKKIEQLNIDGHKSAANALRENKVSITTRTGGQIIQSVAEANVITRNTKNANANDNIAKEVFLTGDTNNAFVRQSQIVQSAEDNGTPLSSKQIKAGNRNIVLSAVKGFLSRNDYRGAEDLMSSPIAKDSMTSNDLGVLTGGIENAKKGVQEETAQRYTSDISQITNDANNKDSTLADSMDNLDEVLQKALNDPNLPKDAKINTQKAVDSAREDVALSYVNGHSGTIEESQAIINDIKSNKYDGFIDAKKQGKVISFLERKINGIESDNKEVIKTAQNDLTNDHYTRALKGEEFSLSYLGSLVKTGKMTISQSNQVNSAQKEFKRAQKDNKNTHADVGEVLFSGEQFKDTKKNREAFQVYTEKQFPNALIQGADPQQREGYITAVRQAGFLPKGLSNDIVKMLNGGSVETSNEIKSIIKEIGITESVDLTSGITNEADKHTLLNWVNMGMTKDTLEIARKSATQNESIKNGRISFDFNGTDNQKEINNALDDLGDNVSAGVKARGKEIIKQAIGSGMPRDNAITYMKGVINNDNSIGDSELMVNNSVNETLNPLLSSKNKDFVRNSPEKLVSFAYQFGGKTETLASTQEEKSAVLREALREEFSIKFKGMKKDIKAVLSDTIPFNPDNPTYAVWVKSPEGADIPLMQVDKNNDTFPYIFKPQDVVDGLKEKEILKKQEVLDKKNKFEKSKLDRRISTQGIKSNQLRKRQLDSIKTTNKVDLGTDSRTQAPLPTLRKSLRDLSLENRLRKSNEIRVKNGLPPLEIKPQFINR